MTWYRVCLLGRCCVRLGTGVRRCSSITGASARSRRTWRRSRGGRRRISTGVLLDSTHLPIEVELKAEGAAAVRHVCVLLTGCWLLMAAPLGAAGTDRASARAPLAAAHTAPSLRSVAP